MSAGKAFGELVDVYDALIDWPRRLAHEEPFYRQLFDEFAVRRVLDVACGPGHHAALFHRWGLAVQGADVSPEMIERARQLHGERPGLEWVVRSFDLPVEADLFDAAICVGNSLALAGERQVVEQAVGRMLAAVRPGGAIAVHVLNLWHLADGPCRWQKCRRLPGPAAELLVVKGVHRGGVSGYVDVVVTALTDPPQFQADSVPFLGLETAELGQAARQAGADRVEFFGGYGGQPYQRRHSVDLIMVASRSETTANDQ